jgi:general secretion pathway protein D
MKTLLALTAILLGSSGLAHAADVNAPQTSSNSTSAGIHGVILRDLLVDLGGRLHKVFIVDPRADTYQVELGGLRAQDITYPELLSLLMVNGWGIVPDGTLLHVVPLTDIRLEPLPIVSPDNLKTADSEFVTCVIPVKGIPAVMLVPILRPLIPQWGHLAALPDRNALILMDRTANVRRLVEMIKLLEGLPKAIPAIEPPAKTPS